jgi:hypothetical protein
MDIILSIVNLIALESGECRTLHRFTEIMSCTDKALACMCATCYLLLAIVTTPSIAILRTETMH